MRRLWSGTVLSLVGLGALLIVLGVTSGGVAWERGNDTVSGIPTDAAFAYSCFAVCVAPQAVVLGILLMLLARRR